MKTLSQPGNGKSDRLYMLGHSYPEAAGVSTVDQGFPWLLASVLNCDLENYAVGGSAVVHAQDAAANGFQGAVDRVFQVPIPSSSTPSVPVSKAVLYSGYNDLGLSDRYSPDGLFAAAYRTIARHLRAELYGPWTDASWVKSTSPAWSTNSTSGFQGFPGGGSVFTANVGAFQTITIPATFRGGTIGLGQLAQTAFAGNFGITVDGVSQPDWDTSAIPQTSSWRVLYRDIIGLSPGTHTIVLTVKSFIGSGIMPSFWEAYSPNPGIVAIAAINRCFTYPTGGSHSPVTDADVLAFNVQIKGVCAEFTDGRVPYVDTDAIINLNPAYFTPNSLGNDGIHQNADGHAALADGFASAFGVSSNFLATKKHVFGGDVLTHLRMPENTDPFRQPKSVVLTLVAGSATWTNQAITANTRIGGCNPIGAPPVAGTVVNARTITAKTSTGVNPGTILVSSDNALDVRQVHLWIYDAATTTPTAN